MTKNSINNMESQSYSKENKSVKFIDYKSLEDAYTIPEACELLEMKKDDLKAKCEQYGIEPTRNEIGDAVFFKI